MISLKSYKLELTKNTLINVSIAFSFIILGFIIAKTLSPIAHSNASEQSSETEVGSYTISMSNDNVATIDITPTSSQQVFEGSNDITLTNTCPAGATITMSTVSSVDNSLERIGSDNKTKTINATSTSNGDLDNNTWGYSINDGSSYSPVPLRNTEPATIYDESRARTSSYNVPITFGVKTDNTLPSGSYSTDIIYTITPKAGCLTYALSWDLNGGTGKSGASYNTVNKNWGDTINLTNYTPTRSGYSFTGWSNGEDTFTGEETEVNINPNSLDTITLTAQWRVACTENCTEADLGINESIGYDYTGAPVGVTLKKAGYYKLEVWGAQGNVGVGCTLSDPGLGGYSVGTLAVTSGKTLYVYVGQQGTGGNSNLIAFNGGGYGEYRGYDSANGGGGGGGASDISLNNGTWDSSTHLYSRIIVAGGGGGGNAWCQSSGPNGGAGGGYRSAGSWPATQSSAGQGGTFGQGCSDTGTSFPSGGGGGGWYGGGCNASDSYTGAPSGGSGFVYNSSSASSHPSNNNQVSSSYYLANAEMYMYSTGCTSSSNAATKTTCTSSTGHAQANAANTGNGYAKITYLGTSI